MKAKTIDKIWTVILYIVAIFVVGLLAVFLFYILYQGRESLSFKFIFGSTEKGGIGRQLFNSFYMLIISLLITIPIGIGAGIFLSEYASENKFVNFVRLCIETMSSLPSIVVGLFGLLLFVTTFKWKYSILSGALSVSILNLPSMTRVTENALRAASKKVKEASLGLGATRWQTVSKVILPSAMPEILTGIILASGRIFGEAAAFLYTSGMSAPELKFNNFNIFGRTSAFSLFRPAETLAVHIWKLNAEGLAANATEIANGASAVLIIFVLLFNVSARLIGNKIHKAYSGN